MKYIILDAGHNVNTAGKRSPDGSLREYEFNMDVARKTAALLAEVDGIRAEVMSSEHASSVSDVNARVALANREKPDAVVSFHANSAGEKGWYKGADGRSWNTAEGWEIYCYEPEDRGEGYKLAKAIHDESIPFLELKDRGIKNGAHLALIRKTTMPVVLIEHAFYTNEAECALLKTQAFREKCALAAANGILAYFGMRKDTTQPADYYKRVQKRFGFEDKTMTYLNRYQYADDLLRKLATAE